jgi:hypothetical protein
MSAALVPASTCPNCGVAAQGNFCANCGQPRDLHLRSVGEVFHDVTHTLTHLDSRAWRTLQMLALRPGKLTTEFFQGRLASYLPPFRLYLVLSVLYFALSATLASYGGKPLISESVVTSGAAATATNRCDLHLDLPWARQSVERLNTACEHALADNGRHFKEAFRSNAPRFLFALVPLVAAIALLLYWRPRRLYAEQLVFFLHGQAFLFLVLIVMELVDGLARLVPFAAGVLGALWWLLPWLLPWYYYLALRRVFGQSRRRSVAKLLVLIAVYMSLLMIALMAGVVYTALQV